MDNEPEQRALQPWPPLWSIGFAAVVMLIVPAILYSIAPEGPIREGDTVFAQGKQRVALADTIRYQKNGYDATCVLERRDPLVVLQRPSEVPESVFRAQVQGRTRLEFPFCPPQGEVLVKLSQVFQKPSLVTDLKDSLALFFAR